MASGTHYMTGGIATLALMVLTTIGVVFSLIFAPFAVGSVSNVCDCVEHINPWNVINVQRNI